MIIFHVPNLTICDGDHVDAHSPQGNLPIGVIKCHPRQRMDCPALALNRKRTTSRSSGMIKIDVASILVGESPSRGIKNDLPIVLKTFESASTKTSRKREESRQARLKRRSHDPVHER